MEDLLLDVLFSNSFQKKNNAWIMNLKNPDLDLNWRIPSKCRFIGFTIRFGILIKKKGKKKPAESALRFKNPDLDFT